MKRAEAATSTTKRSTAAQARARQMLALTSRHVALGQDRRLAAARPAEKSKANQPHATRHAEAKLGPRNSAGTTRPVSNEEFEAWKQNSPEQVTAVTELLGLVASGEITPAKAFGISDDELLEAARLAGDQHKQGRYDNAEKIYAGLAAAVPEVPHFHLSLGQVLQCQGRLEEARNAYGDGIRRLTQSEHPAQEMLAEAVLLRAQVLVRLGHKGAAAEDLCLVLEAFRNRREQLWAEQKESVVLETKIPEVAKVAGIKATSPKSRS